MTLVSSKEFIANEDKYFDLALNGGVCIQRGEYFFHLGSRPFEKRDVAVDIEKNANGNVVAIQKALDAIKPKRLFSDIDDPVAYQKCIRDEWD